jgi:hypothetical protein
VLEQLGLPELADIVDRTEPGTWAIEEYEEPGEWSREKYKLLSEQRVALKNCRPQLDKVKDSTIRESLLETINTWGECDTDWTFLRFLDGAWDSFGGEDGIRKLFEEALNG